MENCKLSLQNLQGLYCQCGFCLKTEIELKSSGQTEKFSFINQNIA